MSIHRIAILVACHNRCPLTLASLESLFRQRSVEDVEIEVFLVDDGCTDGTGDAVRARFPRVRILRGDGNLFWNRGMRLAFDAAQRENFDAYVFFNDDSILYRDALERLVELERAELASGAPVIAVGSMRSTRTGRQTYGGLVKTKRGMSLRFELVEAHPSKAIPCDTMNGNLALIPAEIAGVIGNLEPHFHHQFGDLDYGLRAKRAGFDVVVVPGYAGDCFDNSSGRTWRDPSIPFGERWRHLMSPKGVPFKEWVFFTRSHFGWRWLPYASSPCVRTIASSMLRRDLWQRDKPIREGSGQ